MLKWHLLTRTRAKEAHDDEHIYLENQQQLHDLFAASFSRELPDDDPPGSRQKGRIVEHSGRDPAAPPCRSTESRRPGPHQPCASLPQPASLLRGAVVWNGSYSLRERTEERRNSRTVKTFVSCRYRKEYFSVTSSNTQLSCVALEPYEKGIWQCWESQDFSSNLCKPPPQVFSLHPCRNI